jgi:hypothetical protein
MPAHNADLNDPKSILRILLALVIKNGGELRVKASLCDSQDRGKLLVVDFDPKKNDIVLRATSDYGRVVLVSPENIAWTLPREAAPQERARMLAEKEVQRRAMPTDEDMAAMEEKLTRQQEAARAMEEGKSPLKIRTVV